MAAIIQKRDSVPVPSKSKARQMWNTHLTKPGFQTGASKRSISQNSRDKTIPRIPHDKATKVIGSTRFSQ